MFSRLCIVHISYQRVLCEWDSMTTTYHFRVVFLLMRYNLPHDHLIGSHWTLLCLCFVDTLAITRSLLPIPSTRLFTNYLRGWTIVETRSRSSCNPACLSSPCTSPSIAHIWFSDTWLMDTLCNCFLSYLCRGYERPLYHASESLDLLLPLGPWAQDT